MAPLRRYLRITKYSVLECRIYLENPAVVNSWLLNPRDPVLPRIIESIRPLVLPKLREEKERERTRKKNAKKRSIKDVVIKDDFEVSIFLTETPTRHSLLFKHKRFRDKVQTKLTSNSSKLTGATSDAPVDIDALGDGAPTGPGEDEDDPVTILREETDDDDNVVRLADVPVAEHANEGAAGSDDGDAGRRRSKRRRSSGAGREQHHHQPPLPGGDSSDDQDLFVGDGEDDNSDASLDTTTPGPGDPPPTKRRRDKGPELEPGMDAENENKKKLAMDISYEGFAIYGRVLCLVVKQRGRGEGGGGSTATGRTGSGRARSSGGRGLLSSSMMGSRPHQQGSGGLPGGQGQAVMENWITSTQMPTMAEEDDDDDAT